MEKENLIEDCNDNQSVFPVPNLQQVRRGIKEAEEAEENGDFAEALDIVTGLEEVFDDDFYIDQLEDHPEGFMEFLEVRAAVARLSGKLGRQNDDEDLKDEAENLYCGFYRLLEWPGTKGVSLDYRLLCLKIREDAVNWDFLHGGCDIDLNPSLMVLLEVEGILREAPEDPKAAEICLKAVENILDSCIRESYTLSEDQELIEQLEMLFSLFNGESPVTTELEMARLIGKTGEIFMKENRDDLAAQTFDRQEKILEKHLSSFEQNQVDDYLRTIGHHIECLRNLEKYEDAMLYPDRKIKLLERDSSYPCRTHLVTELTDQKNRLASRHEQMKEHLDEKKARLTNLEKMEDPDREARIEMVGLYSSAAAYAPEFMTYEEAIPLLKKAVNLAEKLHNEEPEERAWFLLIDAFNALDYYRSKIDKKINE